MMENSPKKPMNGLERIAVAYRERLRSDNIAETDDMNDAGELSIAAACYALLGTDHGVISLEEISEPWPENPPTAWPFAPHAFNPSHDVANLVQAGVLIAAELDRVLRMAGEIE